MSDPFIAEVKIFAGNFAPRSWAFCNGQLLPISQNTALFSLIGTTFGGDGETTTALPNLQGRAPMHPGHGPGLSSRSWGQRGGQEQVTLSEAQIPPHTHTLTGSSQTGRSGDSDTPGGKVLGKKSRVKIYADGPADQVMHPSSIANSGGQQPHNNLQPYLTLNFIIALTGTYPSRS